MTLDSVFELIKKFADVLIVWAMFYYILKNLRKIFPHTPDNPLTKPEPFAGCVEQG